MAKRIPQSGTSKAVTLPAVLKYPKFLSLSQAAIRDKFCYIIRAYNPGFSVLVYRKTDSDDVVVVCGDWAGNNIDLVGNKTNISEAASNFIKSEIVRLISAMHIIKLSQAQFFLALDEQGPMLVDMQVAINKLAGPGIIRDIFGKTYRTQEVIKIETCDERVLECVTNGSGNYGGDLVIKPSKFQMQHIVETNEYTPMYVQVIR